MAAKQRKVRRRINIENGKIKRCGRNSVEENSCIAPHFMFPALHILHLKQINVRSIEIGRKRNLSRAQA